MGKLKKAVRYENLPKEVVDVIREQYPDGWKDFVIKVTKPDKSFFFAITVETPEITYLVKVNVRIDTRDDTEKFSLDTEMEHDEFYEKPAEEPEEPKDEEEE
jgi:hypothetical protein